MGFADTANANHRWRGGGWGWGSGYRGWGGGHSIFKHTESDPDKLVELLNPQIR